MDTPQHPHVAESLLPMPSFFPLSPDTVTLPKSTAMASWWTQPPLLSLPGRVPGLQQPGAGQPAGDILGHPQIRCICCVGPPSTLSWWEAVGRAGGGRNEDGNGS